MKLETRIALAKILATKERLEAGLHLVDETVTLSVKGTIKVNPPPKDGAKEPLPWKTLACLAWARLSTADRQQILEAINGPTDKLPPTEPMEADLDSFIIREEKPRAGATTVSVALVGEA